MSPHVYWYRMHLMRRFAKYAVEFRHSSRRLERAGLTVCAADDLASALYWEGKVRAVSKGER